MKDLFIIIGTKNTKKFFLLLSFTVLSAFFEAFSIALILPIISFIASPDFSNYPVYIKFFIQISRCFIFIGKVWLSSFLTESFMLLRIIFMMHIFYV